MWARIIKPPFKQGSEYRPRGNELGLDEEAFSVSLACSMMVEWLICALFGISFSICDIILHSEACLTNNQYRKLYLYP